MRLFITCACVVGAVIAAAALAQSPNSASEPPDPILVACPGVAAFVAREKAREAALRTHPDAPPTQPALAAELKEMYTRDQEARGASIRAPSEAATALVLAVDAANLTRLKTIVAHSGFPTLAMVGHEGMEQSWLLTQHADRDPQFQKQVLAVLEARSGEGIHQGDLAMLEDRIRVKEGKLQIYGGNLDAKTMQPTPIENPDGVDARRARVHLMPMVDYRCLIEQLYKPAH